MIHGTGGLHSSRRSLPFPTNCKCAPGQGGLWLRSFITPKARCDETEPLSTVRIRCFPASCLPARESVQINSKTSIFVREKQTRVDFKKRPAFVCLVTLSGEAKHTNNLLDFEVMPAITRNFSHFCHIARTPNTHIHQKARRLSAKCSTWTHQTSCSKAVLFYIVSGTQKGQSKKIRTT